MSAVTESHKRASKWMTINLASDLNQTTGSKKLNRVRPDDVGPATFLRAFLQFGSECLF